MLQVVMKQVARGLAMAWPEMEAKVLAMLPPDPDPTYTDSRQREVLQQLVSGLGLPAPLAEKCGTSLHRVTDAQLAWLVAHVHGLSDALRGEDVTFTGTDVGHDGPPLALVKDA